MFTLGGGVVYSFNILTVEIKTKIIRQKPTRER
jgi:hypothetical protein